MQVSSALGTFFQSNRPEFFAEEMEALLAGV